MTLNDLEQSLYRALNDNTTADTATQTRYRHYLNATQRELLSEPGMEALLNGTITFASVASTPQYSLPPSVARIKKIYETTNDLALVGRHQDWYRTYDPDTTANTGTPEAYVDLGFTAISVQPSDAWEIFVDSTSASDTGTAYLEGYRTGGYFRALSVTMNSTTAVSFAAAITDFIELTKFYISAAAVGTVTLHEDASGGTELARIPIGQTHARYRRIALWPCPASAITYSVDYERDVQDMANANDEPVLPVRFHPLLAIGARVKEYEKRNDLARARWARDEFDHQRGRLQHFLFAPMDYRPTMGRSQGRDRSRLGPYYPAGS